MCCADTVFWLPDDLRGGNDLFRERSVQAPLQNTKDSVGKEIVGLPLFSEEGGSERACCPRAVVAEWNWRKELAA